MQGAKKRSAAMLEYDLEKELKNDAAKLRELTMNIEQKISDLKKVLRQGAASSDFDTCGTLLHGYSSLLKLVNEINVKL